MTEKNPYIKKAVALVKEDQGQYFIIGLMDCKHNYPLPEDPTFLHDKKLKTMPNRIVGRELGDKRDVIYHAESAEQAERILKLFLKGKGYSINGFPVIFKEAKGKLSNDLETRIQDTRAILNFREVPQYRER